MASCDVAEGRREPNFLIVGTVRAIEGRRATDARVLDARVLASTEEMRRRSCVVAVGCLCEADGDSTAGALGSSFKFVPVRRLERGDIESVDRTVGERLDVALALRAGGEAGETEEAPSLSHGSLLAVVRDWNGPSATMRTGFAASRPFPSAAVSLPESGGIDCMPTALHQARNVG